MGHIVRYIELYVQCKLHHQGQDRDDGMAATDPTNGAICAGTNAITY
jgi:hypothetical protein